MRGMVEEPRGGDLSEDDHPSTDASEDSVEVRVAPIGFPPRGRKGDNKNSLSKGGPQTYTHPKKKTLTFEIELQKPIKSNQTAPKKNLATYSYPKNGDPSLKSGTDSLVVPSHLARLPRKFRKAFLSVQQSPPNSPPPPQSPVNYTSFSSLIEDTDTNSSLLPHIEEGERVPHIGSVLDLPPSIQPTTPNSPTDSHKVRGSRRKLTEPRRVLAEQELPKESLPYENKHENPPSLQEPVPVKRPVEDADLGSRPTKLFKNEAQHLDGSTSNGSATSSPIPNTLPPHLFMGHNPLLGPLVNPAGLHPLLLHSAFPALAQYPYAHMVSSGMAPPLGLLPPNPYLHLFQQPGLNPALSHTLNHALNPVLNPSLTSTHFRPPLLTPNPIFTRPPSPSSQQSHQYRPVILKDKVVKDHIPPVPNSSQIKPHQQDLRKQSSILPPNGLVPVPLITSQSERISSQEFPVTVPKFLSVESMISDTKPQVPLGGFSPPSTSSANPPDVTLQNFQIKEETKEEEDSDEETTIHTLMNQTKKTQRNYKNMTRERRIEANARERTRVHTISAAFDKLRKTVPAYSHNQKLSKLSILRIACSYIMALGKMEGGGNEHSDEGPSFSDCVEMTTRTIQIEGKAKKKRED